MLDKVRYLHEENYVQTRQLIALRQARCYSKADIARMLGISKETVSRWELGIEDMEPYYLDSLCRELHVPTKHLLVEFPPPEINSLVFYQQNSQITDLLSAQRKAEWVHAIRLFLERVVQFPYLDLPCFRTEAGLDILSIEHLANRLRWEWGMEKRPVQNLTGLLERKGCVVVHLDLGSLKSFSIWQYDRPYLLVNSRLQAYEQRIQLAIHLGHWVLHTGQSEWEVSSPMLFNEASRFARAFLLPAYCLREEKNLGNWQDWLKIRRRWRMPLVDLWARSKSLNLMTQEKQEFWSQFCGDLETMDGDAWRSETSFLLHRAIDLCLRKDLFSISSLLEELPFLPEELSELVGLPRGYVQSKLLKEGYGKLKEFPIIDRSLD